MLQMHDLAIELLKPGNHDGAAAALLEALVLDYPDRLESRFWLAAARHNVYLERLDAESKTRALGVIDGFLEAARGHPDYRSNVEAIEGIRRSKY